MKRIASVLLLELLAIMASPDAVGQSPAGPPRHKQWRLVFDDEFDGKRLDESKWTRSRSSSPAFLWNGGRAGSLKTTPMSTARDIS